MSGYCPVCGAYCEEDDDRVCAACKAEKKNHHCPECAAKWADEAFAAVRRVKADEIDCLTRENADLRAKLEEAVILAGDAASEAAQAKRMLAATEKAHDTQAEAVVQLGLCLRDAMKTMRYCQEQTCRCNSAANPCPHCRFNSSLGWIEWKIENNPTAAAAVKEASNGRMG